jgi:putative serine/threonine protein kinase
MRLSATQSERAPLSQLVRTPYIRILTYPRISLRTAKSRIKQLDALGVDELVFEGRTKIGRLGLLGLGTVGVVVRASVGGSTYALKIRRTDANRPSMDEEFRLTTLANRVGVGVQALNHSRDFMLMQLLDYTELYEWAWGLKGPGTRASVREMMHMVLNQCRKLDIINLDHGQLSNLRKHVVVASARPWMMDFESAGTDRKPRNVTTAAQYLFIGSRMSPLVRRILGLGETAGLLHLLRAYKQDLSDFSYAKILEWLSIPAG